MITRVPFILQRTHPSIQRLNIYNLGTIHTVSLENGPLKLEKMHTSQNHVDMLTKVVTREKLSSCSVFIALQARTVKVRNFLSLELEDSPAGLVAVELL